MSVYKEWEYVDQYKYLGFILTSDKTDAKDIIKQLRYNYVLSWQCFINCMNPLSLIYFYNLYCCQLWSNFQPNNLQKVRVAYNNVFRNLLNYNFAGSLQHVADFHV